MSTLLRSALLTYSLGLFAGTALAQSATPPGGAPPKLNGTSEKAYRASVARAKRVLSPADRKRLDQSLQLARQLFGTSFLQRVDGESVTEVLPLHELALKRLDRNRNGKIEKSELAAAVGRVEDASKNANESAAIATLRNLSSAQMQIQAAGVIDLNSDGLGEFAYFGEMTGAIALRNEAGKPGAHRLSPPVLSNRFKVTRGLVERSGYLFQVWLPNGQGRAVAEGQRGGVGAFAPDPAKAAHSWCAYAWPVDHGKSGQRAFFVTHKGEVYATDNEKQRYGGRKRPPSPYAAFPLGAEKLGSLPARAMARNDRGTWTKVR